MQKGVLTISGSGYRRERKGSPLANIWRQYCDARVQPCVVLARGAGAGGADAVLVDLSTLRLEDATQVGQAQLGRCTEQGLLCRWHHSSCRPPA